MASLAELIGDIIGGRQRQANLTDEGHDRMVLAPNRMEVVNISMVGDGTLSLEVDSVNDSPVNVIILDERNLTYLQTGQANFATVFESGMVTNEELSVDLPEGEWYVVYYNEDQQEQAVVYLEWEIYSAGALGI